MSIEVKIVEKETPPKKPVIDLAYGEVGLSPRGSRWVRLDDGAIHILNGRVYVWPADELRSRGSPCTPTGEHVEIVIGPKP